MYRKLITTPVSTTGDVRQFFDGCARAYSEQHGDPERLLNYRIGFLKRYARPCPDDLVLDIACGNGHHLEAIADQIKRGIGVDLSPEMVRIAEERLRRSPWRHKLDFYSANAEEPGGLPEQTVDLALCIGALEHMLDKGAVLKNAYRALKPGGRFFCLTTHRGYLWYRRLAPALGFETRHLSTDRSLTPAEFVRLLKRSGFRQIHLGFWTFIPKADMPAFLGAVCGALDIIGKVLRISSFRGGLWACARREK